MAKTRALIVGVSNYPAFPGNDLPFCKNDICAIRQAFYLGLGVDPADVAIYGASGTVTTGDIRKALHDLSAVADNEDTVLIYFSGHGCVVSNSHCLAFSDGFIRTQELIGILDQINAKSKVLFLDCCLAGNFTVKAPVIFDINKSVSDFVGIGYAVIASCSAQQYSYPHPQKPISLFTYFLYQALTHRLIIREGKKSLYEIYKLLSVLLEGWNKNNPTKIQTPIYRASIGGTIFFNVEDYRPYVVDQFHSECDSYIVYSVKPLHSSIAKRYSVQIILKHPMSFAEIAAVNHEVLKTVKHLNIYGNKAQEDKWMGKEANIVFCYFGFENSDMLNTNYLCHTTWVDETQDKSWWYRTDKNCEVIDNIHFTIQPYYQSLKYFMEEHTAVKERLIVATRKIITQMISLAEQIIFLYNEFLNGTITEYSFRLSINGPSAELEKLYFSESNLEIPPDDLSYWAQCCSNLAGSAHDLTLYYGQNNFTKRTPENRKACMDMSIKQYYKDLEKLRAVEAN